MENKKLPDSNTVTQIAISLLRGRTPHFVSDAVLELGTK